MSKDKFTRDVHLDPKSVVELLDHVIINNVQLQKNGKRPVAFEIKGESGLGKTSIVQQVAEKHNKVFVKLNLAQIEELGDLVGFPMKEYEVCDTIAPVEQEENVIGFIPVKQEPQNCEWVNEITAKHYLADHRELTGNSRMSYAPPEWIAGQDGANGGILLLDDWNRADPRFLQAVMELVDRQEYISWKLPKAWTIVLTANPDTGGYLVNSTDVAQQTRFISVNMDFDKETWAKWAEQAGIDGRCINFILFNPEVVTDGLKHGVNPRGLVNFFNCIEGISDFSSTEGLTQIQLLGNAAVGEYVSSMFTAFINNKLDKLISPEDMLFNKNTTAIMDNIKQTVGSGDKYRADIAYVLSCRIINKSIEHATSNPIDDPLCERLEGLVSNGIFNVDVCYNIVRTIHSANTQKFRKLAIRPKVMKYLTT